MARKRHRSFCQKCRWQVTPNTRIHSFPQRSRSGLAIPLSKHSVETYPETNSHATYQGTFVHSRLSSLSHCGLILAESGISVRELIFTLKEKAGGESMVEHSPKILADPFTFFNCIVPMEFLPWKIQVAFPRESQLRQSRATQPTVHHGCSSVSIIHRTQTWTTGSLTGAQM